MANEKEVKLGGKSTEAQGELKIIRPSGLAKEGKTGLVAEGIYEGAKPNKFNAAKSDYFIRDTRTNTLQIVNETSSLKEALGELTGNEGMWVRVRYNGKKSTKSGRGFHDFEVSAVPELSK